MKIQENDVLSKFIKVYRNFVPKELCKRIITEVDKENSWESHKDEQYRTCDTFYVAKVPELDSLILKISTKAIIEYINTFSGIFINEDKGFSVLRYKVGDECKKHIDYSTHEVRNFTASINLNDNYEGGEFCFFDKSSCYTLGTGDVVIFPSNFMFPHEVTPITKGTRYSIITWYA